MAISVISVSLDSSEESVGTPVGRVILFGTIPTTIPDTTPTISPPNTHTDTPMTPTEIPTVLPSVPPSPDHTPALPDITLASPDYSPTSDTKSDPSEDPSSNHIPPLPAILPFVSSVDDTTNSDTPDTPPSPTHGTPFIEITPSTQRSPVIPRRRVMTLAPGQPIPYRRPYRYHLNGPLHMLTAKKRVGPFPTHRLVVRHFVYHSSSDYFSPDDSARNSSSDSSSEASSDFHSDASSDSSSRHSLPDHSSPDSPSTSAGPYDVGVDESYSEHEIDPMQVTIEVCFDFTDIIRSRGIDVRVVAETVARDEIGTDTRDIVEGGDDRVTHPVVSDDVQEERAAEGMYETLGSLVQRKMPNTLSRASMTHEEIKDLISSRLTEEVEARNRGNENGENENENGNGGRNGNGNINGNHGMNYGGFMPVAREGTFQDFLKCKPHNFSRTKGCFWIDVMVRINSRGDDEAITFKVGQTSRYSYNDAVSINRIDVIDVACQEYAQEVLGFLDSSTSGNPTPSFDPIPFTSSPSLTPFEEGDFILEEIEACLTNDSIPSRIDDDDFDPEGDLSTREVIIMIDPSISSSSERIFHVEELKIVNLLLMNPRA
ncbi:hypothetical protein Tco_0908739 [Tanacetum coccineum]|uniref:Uncharacterized protein n=1 Tax=Tanacetum coccineum TaxID=301880 RepID=A0ABQ5CUH8_9ASTR